MFYYVFYYAIMAARHTYTHTVIHSNTYTKNTKTLKTIKTVKRNRTGKTHATLGLIYCAGERVPYSLLYCLPADVMYWLIMFVPSVLWHCWSGVRKNTRCVKIDWWGVGLLVWLTVWSEVQIVCMWSSADATAIPKPGYPLPHLNPDWLYLYPGCPGKEAVKWA